MQQSDAIEMLKRIRDQHDSVGSAGEIPSYMAWLHGRMPHIREIIHQLDELDPDEISEVDEQ